MPSTRDHTVALLGPVELRAHGASLPIGGTKIRAVLALLALDSGRTVAAESLVAALWGEDPPATAGNAVQVYVAGLRKAFRTAGIDGALQTVPRGYRLDLPAGSFDRDEFLAARARAARAVELGDPQEAARAFEDALGIWRGPAMFDVSEIEAVRRKAEQLDDLELATFEAYAELELELGHAARMVPQLERRSRQHPLREALWALRALAHYRAGDQVAAIGALREIRATLADELGIDPGPALAALEVAVLRHDPALLSGRPAAVPDSPSVRPERTVTVQRSELADAAGTLVLPDGTRRELGSAPCSIGRDERCDIRLQDAGVSSRHARIYASSHGHVIEDLMSRNGTVVNGQFVTRAQLVHGDRIEVGRSTLRYECAGSVTESRVAS